MTASKTVTGAAVEARAQAGQLTERVRSQAINKADERKSGLVDQTRTFTKETNKIAEQLKTDGMEKPAELLQAASREVEHMIAYVERTPVQEIMQDASRRMKRTPIAFLGAAVAVGFVGSRILKASSNEAQAQLPQTAGSTSTGISSSQGTRRFQRSGAATNHVAGVR